MTWIPPESGAVDNDQTPAHLAHVYQEGTWELGPPAGPYTSLSGVLQVLEYLDQERPTPGPGDTAETGFPLVDTADTGSSDSPLLCSVAYALSGVAIDSCPGCDFAFEVTHTVTMGNPNDCHDPDLPADGAILSLGFAPDYEPGQDWLLLDYGDSGLWLPWYPALQFADNVDFAWEATIGIYVEEEEE